MRPKKLMEFRTPQHPSIGKNYWGGASPLLARNVPKESLEQRYSRLHTVRTYDEFVPDARVEKKAFFVPPRLVVTVRGIWPKFQREEKNRELGSGKKKRRWFPALDAQKRWPQGWC